MECIEERLSDEKVEEIVALFVEAGAKELREGDEEDEGEDMDES